MNGSFGQKMIGLDRMMSKWVNEVQLGGAKLPANCIPFHISRSAHIGTSLCIKGDNIIWTLNIMNCLSPFDDTIYQY